MKTPIHVQLRNSLLFEAIGGGYKSGQRFLSNRKICRRWRISDTTARKALRWLVEEKILRARAQSGYFLRAGYHKRALLLLHKQTRNKLPSPRSLATSRFQYLPGSGRKRRRIGLVWYDDEPSSGVGRLPPKMLATGWDWSHGFFTEAVASDCEVHFFVQNLQVERQRFVLASMVEAKLDGVAIFARLKDPALPLMLKSLARANIPTIRVFGDSEGVDIPTVNLNNVAMGYTAAKRFLKLGHRRMVVLMDTVRQTYFEQRLEGFRIALEEEPVATSLHIARVKPGSVAGMTRLLRDRNRRPTAVFASRIEQFAVVEPILKTMGLRVPEDVSVITCGGTVQLPEMERAVDSFIIDFSEMGKKAFQRLHETVQGKLREKHTLIDLPLRRQGSTAKAPPDRLPSTDAAAGGGVRGSP